MDSSCSFEGSFTGKTDPDFGAIVGHLYDNSTIENSVNMASISFKGELEYGHLYFGGIVGLIWARKNGATVKDCVNYGSVTHTGIVSGSYT